MNSDDLPGPLRHFLTRLDELRHGDIIDMDQVGRLLVELAADEEYLGPLIAEMPSESPGGRWLVKPERGPRLVLFHRPEGVMAYTHSHHCWVAIAPVRGVESHQRWDAVRHEGGRAELRLADESAMTRGDVATLFPPGDVHNHGHVLGSGPSPYRSSSWVTTCTSLNGKSTTPSRGPGGSLHPVIQAGPIAEFLDGIRGRNPSLALPGSRLPGVSWCGPHPAAVRRADRVAPLGSARHDDDLRRGAGVPYAGTALLIVPVAAPTNAVVIGHPSSWSTVEIERQVSILGGGQHAWSYWTRVSGSERDRTRNRGQVRPTV